MDNQEFIERCKIAVVRDVVESHGEAVIPFSTEDVFIVWSCKTLQNNKALLATNIPSDQAYYEFTYNGDKKELYMDKYIKVTNQSFKVED